MPPGRLILHIGRNKAGSTTLQALCLRQRTMLAEHNILYCLFGHLADSVPGVPGFALVPQLAAYAAANPNRTILVSNEFMFAWPDAFTASLVHDLAGTNLTVIAYIRPYFDWLRSAYAEAIATGETTLSFDAYTTEMRPKIPAYPYLACYADRLGWPRLRIRSLHPAALHQQNLQADFLQAIGLPDNLATPAPPDNPSEHWAVLELLRTLIRPAECWPGPLYQAGMQLRAALRHLVATQTQPLPEAAYGTEALRQELDALYNADLAKLEAHTGHSLPPAPTGAPIPSAPSLELLPQTLITQATHLARQTIPAEFLTEAAATPVPP